MRHFTKTRGFRSALQTGGEKKGTYKIFGEEQQQYRVQAFAIWASTDWRVSNDRKESAGSQSVGHSRMIRFRRSARSQ